MRQNGSGNFSKVLISPINDASSEFCIAEGELDINHPTLGIIVASPQYWLENETSKQPTLTSTAQVMLNEIHILALREIQAGRPWFCPSMQRYHLS
jgi:hypothetical protein